MNKTKRRIVSVKSTKKITKAMGMVSTVKLKRYRDVFDSSNGYSLELQSLMAELFQQRMVEKTHYASYNEGVESTLYLLITSDLGLCAGYNNELYKYVDSLLKEGDVLMPIGQKGVNHYQRNEPKGVKVDLTLAPLGLDPDPSELSRVLKGLKDDFNAKKYRNIVLIYTHYVNSLRFDPSTYQLLPVVLDFEKKSEDSYCPKIVEPDAKTMIHLLLPDYLASVFMAKLTESKVSEQASRRSAMDKANDNADELIDKLTIEYNKARQSAITQEITEVVSGAKAQQ
ncbi:MAG: ATP synthase F1 subunit gamma [Bacilli bacterium]|nr:ATP synthase F1 subunit gamma [Bacilli bacterium]